MLAGHLEVEVGFLRFYLILVGEGNSAENDRVDADTQRPDIHRLRPVCCFSEDLRRLEAHRAHVSCNFEVEVIIWTLVDRGKVCNLGTITLSVGAIHQCHEKHIVRLDIAVHQVGDVVHVLHPLGNLVEDELCNSFPHRRTLWAEDFTLRQQTHFRLDSIVVFKHLGRHSLFDILDDSVENAFVYGKCVVCSELSQITEVCKLHDQVNFWNLQVVEEEKSFINIGIFEHSAHVCLVFHHLEHIARLQIADRRSLLAPELVAIKHFDSVSNLDRCHIVILEDLAVGADRLVDLAEAALADLFQKLEFNVIFHVKDLVSVWTFFHLKIVANLQLVKWRFFLVIIFVFLFFLFCLCFSCGGFDFGRCFERVFFWI